MALGDNLLNIPPTHLPEDHVDVQVREKLDGGADASELAAAHPESCAAWAHLAHAALKRGATIESYAYARTGYHRGLDALRRNGWRGAGPVPLTWEPNKGVLSAIAALLLAARAIGETHEEERLMQLLRDCDGEAPAHFGIA